MTTEEGRQLGEHWDKIGQKKLDNYLIQEVEHPGYNSQSVLMRAFHIDWLLPGSGTSIIEEELYYSACVCHAIAEHRKGKFNRLYHTLRYDKDYTGLPQFLNRETQKVLGQNFNLLKLYSELAICFTVGFDNFESPFASRWRDFLSEKRSDKCKVLEVGCGSANDYRFLASYGVSQFLDYHGLDASTSNIRNAKARFPEIDFCKGDVCNIDAEDEAFDIVYSFDVLEHFSPTALQAAIRESLRVTKDELWISLFNADHIASHIIQPEREYFWNLLSISELAEDIQLQGFSVEAISVAKELESRFSDYHHYNQQAHILIARRQR